MPELPHAAAPRAVESFTLPAAVAIVVPRHVTLLAAPVFTGRDVERVPETPPPRLG